MRTVFLDRDGVINRKRPEGKYVKSWDEFEFLSGVEEAIRLLNGCGFRVIVITNQRGISLGKFRECDLSVIHDRMRRELQCAGVRLDAVYYCPHDHNSCTCRKPDIGLFLQAQRDFPDIHFPSSLVVGDSLVDMEAAARLGCKKILVGNGTGETLALLTARNIRVDVFANSLLEAVTEFLLRQHEGRSGKQGL